MKSWRTRILSAFIAFAIGTGAVIVLRFCLKPAPKNQTVNVAANTAPLSFSDELPSFEPPLESTEPPPQPMKPHSVSISPYEIKKLVDEDMLSSCQLNGYTGYVDFGSVWEKLNLEINHDSADFPENCSSSAKAYLFPIELDGRPGNEIVLQLDFGIPEATLYLIFNHTGHTSNTAWNLLGSIPFSFGAPFMPPSHKVITDGQHHWLVIEYSTGHGSAFGTSAEDWYEVSDNGVSKVLSYRSGLYLGMGNPTIDSDTKVLKCEHRDGTSTVILQTSISYGSYDVPYTGDEPLPLWTSKWQATYLKLPGMREFIPDTFRSPTVEEFDMLDKYGEVKLNHDFLKYNYAELAKIATLGDKKRKEWLRAFLEEREECIEKQSLQKLLEENSRK